MKNYNPKSRDILLINFIFLFFISEFFINTPIVSAFNLPEKLEYDLMWTGIKAGTATLEITKTDNSVKITSVAQSTKLISFFYTVDNRVESISARKESPPFIGQPVNYKLKIREGKRRTDKEVIFNDTATRATYIDHIKNEKREVDLPPSIFDPMSAFFHVRTLPLEVGKSVYVTVLDNRKIWNVEVQVLRKERVSSPRGSVDTIVIKPLLQSEGIFYRKGDVYIWLTDDEKRIPVKLQAKVTVGSITAALVGGSY